MRHADVDILIRRSDFERARSALEKEGFVYRRSASLGHAGTLDLFLDGPGASARDALHIVFANEKIDSDSILEAPDVSESAVAEFSVISLQALVRMKLTAFRDKDRTHLRDLIEAGLVDRSWLQRLPGDLRERLQQIFETPEG